MLLMLACVCALLVQASTVLLPLLLPLLPLLLPSPPLLLLRLATIRTQLLQPFNMDPK